jgi:hypothetical protein
MDAFEAVSAPGPSTVPVKRHFTPAEATRALPLVRRIVSDIVREYQRFRELHETCRTPAARRKRADAETARRRYVALTDHLSELKEELDKVGCELKDYQIGLVDFPGMIDGREICLCWKLGEERVAFWHEVDAGYSGRTPVEEGQFEL